MDGKPSVPAMRAALEIEYALRNQVHVGLEQKATIIERETGVGELLEAAIAYLGYTRGLAIGKDFDGPPIAKALKAAIAKAKGEDHE